MYALLPETAFLAFSIRLNVFGASIGDSIALLVVASLIGYKKWMTKSQMEGLDLLKNEINLVRNSVQSLKDQELSALRDSINGLKVDKAFQINKKVVPVEQTNQNEQRTKRFF
jgi:transcription initiation factor IIE alpha subunit